MNSADSSSSRDMTIYNLEGLLNNVKSLKEQETVLKRDLEKYYNTLNLITKAKSSYQKIEILCTNGLNSYKAERLKCLEEQVKENLNKIFPGDNFNVKFETSTYRGKEIIDFYTGHGDRLFPTRMQNGRFFRQICSFSISTMIQILAGCEILIMDEAINSGDMESTHVVSDLLHNLIDNGYQIILIEHKDTLYKDLPRVQYNLVRDKSENKITEVIRSEYT
jgi:hypothetical protein